MVHPNCSTVQERPAKDVARRKELDEFELQDESELAKEDKAVTQWHKKELAKAPQPPFQVTAATSRSSWSQNCSSLMQTHLALADTRDPEKEEGRSCKVAIP